MSPPESVATTDTATGRAPGGARPRLEFPLLTADEVARTMLGGLPAKTVNQYARQGRLPSVWIGKHRRFNRPEVEEAITRAVGRGGRL